MTARTDGSAEGTGSSSTSTPCSSSSVFRSLVFVAVAVPYKAMIRVKESNKEAKVIRRLIDIGIALTE